MTEPKVITSAKYSVTSREWLRGLLNAIGAALFPIVMGLFQAWQTGAEYIFNWKLVAGVAGVAGLTYIGISFFSPSKVITITGKQRMKEVASKIRNFV